MGPNPLLGVDRSLNAIDQHSTRRIEDLERTAMDRLTRCWYLESDPKKLKGFNAFDKKKLTDRLILRTADRVYDNWLQGRNNYEYCEWDQVVEEKRAFFVRRRYSEQELKSIENGKNALPVYVNSRIVATVYHYKDGNPVGMSFHCSCHQFQRTNGIGPLYGFNLQEMAPPTEVTSDYDDCGSLSIRSIGYTHWRHHCRGGVSLLLKASLCEWF
jgi:hypothetical protein